MSQETKKSHWDDWPDIDMPLASLKALKQAKSMPDPDIDRLSGKIIGETLLESAKH